MSYILDIACDESGHTGPDLLHKDQRFAWCGSTPAQQRTLPLVALLTPRTFAPNTDAFRRGLHELGYVEGQNIALEVRSAEGDIRRRSRPSSSRSNRMLS